MMSIIPEQFKTEVELLVGGNRDILGRLNKIYSYKGYQSWALSIQVLKEELRAEGKRGQVDFTVLSKAYADKNYKSLMDLLQELFLDVISEADIDVMLEYITTKDKLKKLYNYATTNNRFFAGVMEV